MQVRLHLSGSNRVICVVMPSGGMGRTGRKPLSGEQSVRRKATATGHLEPKVCGAYRREYVDRAEKRAFVTTLNGSLKESGSVVVAHYAGLTVAQMQTLRRQMKGQGASVKVAKNRLTKLALNGSGVADFTPLLKGPTILAYAKDPVAAPKVAVEFAKGHEKFIVLGGALGMTSLDASAVKDLASLPSLDELRGKLIGLLQAPATKVAGVVQAPASQLARVVAAYSDKGEAA